MYKNKSILVTGGTGSVGKVLCNFLMTTKIKKLIVFSRDEYKQHHMEIDFKKKYPEEINKIKFVIGDIKDLDSILKATMGVDYIIHTAALKHVPICERNPIESIEVNINGCRNIIDAAVGNKVKKVLFVSTDKATNPSNTYGATKLLGDKLCIDANKYRKTKFAVIRFGNIFGSRGSLIEFLFRNPEQVYLTDPRMARVFISWDDLLNRIVYVLKNMNGGEIFIAKSKSIKIIDLIKTISPESDITVTGLREGEKLVEIMLSQDDIASTIYKDDFYIILSRWCQERYGDQNKVSKDLVYTSEHNEFYDQGEIIDIINRFNQKF